MLAAPEAATDNPRWTFLEEQFETCSSCNGSALDPYAGARRRGNDASWLTIGAHAWETACAKHIEPFVTRPDPFQPLSGIRSRGYRVETRGTLMRIKAPE